MPFAVPTVWCEPANHANIYCFCLTKVFGYSKRTKSRIVYPDCPSALRLVTSLHENISIPTPPVSKRNNDSSPAESIAFSQTSKISASITLMFSDEESHSSKAVNVPQLVNQNDLVRDFGFNQGKIGAL